MPPAPDLVLPTPSSTPTDSIKATQSALLSFATLVFGCTTQASAIASLLRRSPVVALNVIQSVDLATSLLAAELSAVRSELSPDVSQRRNDIRYIMPVMLDDTSPVLCRCSTTGRCSSLARVTIHLRDGSQLVRCFACIVPCATSPCPSCTVSLPATGNPVLAVCHASSRRPSLHFRQAVEINGVTFDALCDTAAPDCMRCDTTLTPTERRRLRPYDGPRLVGANTAELDVLGTVQTAVTIQAIHFAIPFIVCQRLAVPILIGWDFMQRHVRHIDAQFNDWSVIAWCPPHLDSYVAWGPRLHDSVTAEDTEFFRDVHYSPASTVALDDLTDSTVALDDLTTPPWEVYDCPGAPLVLPAVHQRGPCFSDLVDTVLYHWLPPVTRDLSLQGRVAAWLSIFDHDPLPVLMITDESSTVPALECSEDLDDTSVLEDLPMRCPLCNRWDQAFDVCLDCAHRLGITFGGLPSPVTQAAFAQLASASPAAFNADNELSVPPPLIAHSLLSLPFRYEHALASAAAFLTSGVLFHTSEFQLAAATIVDTFVLPATDTTNPAFVEACTYTMAAIALKMRPFVVPDADLLRSLALHHGPGYQRTLDTARTFALAAQQRRRGTPVFFNGRFLRMCTLADVHLCHQLNLLQPAAAGVPNLAPAPSDRVSSKFTPSEILSLRSSVPNFDDILSANAQSAYNLGLSTFDPSKTRSSSTASARAPYMTRARGSRPHADTTGEHAHADASGEHARANVCRRSTRTSSTTAGPHRGTTTSRTASTPTPVIVPDDLVAAGERVVPGGTLRTNQWF